MKGENMENLYCPKCNIQLEYDDKYQQYYCQSCHQLKTKEQWMELENKIKLENMDWNMRLVHEDIWNTTIFDNSPYIIAHEYARIRELLEEGCVFGALLQIKDTFEVLLKFYVLLEISKINNKKEKNKQEKDILKKLTMKPLSLGDWGEIANSIIEYNNDNQSETVKIIKYISEVFKKKNIVSWRNREIGHGALKLQQDTQYILDVKNKITILKDIFDKLETSITQAKFFCEKGEEIDLIGREIDIDNIKNNKLNIYLEIEGEKYNTYPFIKFDEKGIYFFDTYIRNKEKTDILNYPVGHKISKTKKEFNDIHKIYNQLLKEQVISQQENNNYIQQDSNTYNEAKNQIIESIKEVRDYIEPTYLVNKVNQFIYDEKSNRGIMLLQMERGMGKTTFAIALDDQKSENNITLQDVTTRAFYLDEKYKNTGDKMYASFESKMKENNIGERIIEGIVIKENNPKKRLANLLYQYQNEYQKRFNKKKILIIIDGIDEVKEQQGISVYDYIPNIEDVPENVYILITCRSDNEISLYTKEEISKLQFTHKEVVKKENRNNIETLTKYIKDNITQEKKIISEILQKSDNRFLYVKMAEIFIDKKRIKNTYQQLPQYKKMYDRYMEKLKGHYGKKRRKKILNIIEVLAIAYEPLTFREIMYLIGEDNPSYDIVAYFEDLKYILKSERVVGRDTVYSIVNEDMKQQIINSNKDRIQNSIKRYLKMFDENMDSQDELVKNLKKNMDMSKKDRIKYEKDLQLFAVYNNEQNDAEIYILTYIVQYLEDYCDNREIKEEYYNKLIETVKPPITNFTYKKYMTERIIVLFRKLINLMMITEKNENDLARVYMNLGVAYRGNNQLKEAIEEYEKAKEIIEGLRREGKLPNENDLANILY